MAVKASLKDFEPFFGGDKKGGMLVQAMFNGTNYTDRVDFHSGLMTELLRASNFKNWKNVRSQTNGQAQLPDDVHQELTDLIITTALFHRLIDQSASAGTNLGEAQTKIIDSMMDYLNSSYNPIATYRVPHSVADVTGRNVNIVYGSRTPSDDILYFMVERAMWDAQHNGGTNTLSTKRDNTMTHDEWITWIIDCAVPGLNKNSTTDLNLCWGSVLKNPEVVTALQAIDTPNRVINVIDSIQNALRTVMKRMIMQIKNDVMTEEPGVSNGRLAPNRLPTNDVAGKFGVTTVRNFLAGDRKMHYDRMFKDMARAAIANAIRTSVNTTFTIPHTTLRHPEAKNFFDQVYKSWPSMSSDLKLFYGQNISIFAKVGSSSLYDISNDQYRQQHMKMDWVRLTPRELDALFAKPSFSPAEYANLRVNLMKNPASGYSEILFGSNLPDIPTGANVWYTKSNGAFGHVQTPPVDFLRRLYSSVYGADVSATGDIHVRYTNPTIVFTLSNVEGNYVNRSKNPFDLDIGKFVNAAIQREDAAMTSSIAPAPVSGDLSSYPFMNAYDMAYGKLWSFDAQKGQYFRTDENNRRVYYDEGIKGDTSTCYATYLAKGDSAGCIRVIQCLADGNSKSLNRCLEVIGDGDLWTVASDDVTKVSPDMVKLVLRKFGVKGYDMRDSNGVSYRIPMSYEEWKHKIVPTFDKDVADTILNNSKLNTYLRGLISVCRSNPSIINKNNPTIVARDNTPDYFKNLNMRQYRVIDPQGKTKFETFAEMLRNATEPPIVSQNLFNPFIGGYGSNMMFFNPHTNQLPAMMGGGFYAATVPSLITSGTSMDDLNKQSNILKTGSSSMFTSLLTNIKNAFNDVGLQLHPEDIQRIVNTVTKLNEYEEQLARLCTILINIVKLARFYGVSLENVDRDNQRTVKLSDIQSGEDIRDFVRGHVRQLTSNMVTNMSVQQASAYELMSKIGPRFFDDCAGKTSASGTGLVPSSEQQLVDI